MVVVTSSPQIVVALKQQRLGVLLQIIIAFTSEPRLNEQPHSGTLSNSLGERKENVKKYAHS